MRVVRVDATTVSVPYVHREVSSQVARDGVTDVIVRVETDDGVVGWGESCSGADAASVEAAVRAMTPFVLGRDPWNREAMRDDLFQHGLWQFRAGTGNFAWAGLDMALLDACGKSAGRAALPPVRRPAPRPGLRTSTTSRAASDDDLAAQCAAGLAKGYETLYLKVGVDPAEDLRDGRRHPRGARARPAAAAGRQRQLERAGGAARSSGRWPSTTSTSWSSRCATTRSASWRRCGRGCRWRSAPTRACGARPTRTCASRAGRPTCTASARTGSAASGRSSTSATSRTTRGCRSASTRTASSAWPPRPRSTCC